MRRPRPRNILLPILILIAGLIISRMQQNQPAAPPKQAPEGTFSGKVVGVSDGDTIKVLYNNKEVKVRLWGIDCPEKKQAFGTKAKNFTSDMVFGRNVTVESRDTDRYGRTVGWVTAPDGRVLNRELLRAGLAWYYEDYAPHAYDLQSLENQASAARKGLWSAKNPMPPWQYRKIERYSK